MIDSDHFWMIDDDSELATKLYGVALDLYNGQGVQRRNVAEAALTLYYGNQRHTIGGGYLDMGLADALGRPLEPPGQNVIQMCVDTMVSHTMRNRVRSFFLTERGEVSDQKRAKGMMQACEGIAYLHQHLDLIACKSGYIFDGGFHKVTCDYARNCVAYSIVWPWEWLIPENEARSGNPRQAFHVYPVDRSMLLEDWGFDENEDGERTKNELYEKIENAQNAPKDMILDAATEDGKITDMVLVVEAYHLPSGYVNLDSDASFGLNEDGDPDDDVNPGHDGLRVVMIQGTVLHREPYPDSEFPVAEFTPAKDPIGYWSRGVPETLAGAQLAINRYSQRIDNIIHHHARPIVIVWKNAKLNKSQFSNDVATILESAVPPSNSVYYLQPPGVPAELIQQRQQIIQWALEQYGVNPMALFGEKPPGVDHAPGMEHLLEETNLRHTEKFRAWENFRVKRDRLTIEAIRKMAMRDPDFEVMFGDNKSLRRIKWSEIELPRMAFMVKAWPTSMLPQTPAMKRKALAELVASQQLSPQQAQRAIASDYPDIEAVVGDSDAEIENIMRMLDKCAEDGFSEDTMPTPDITVEIALPLAKQRINRLEADGVEDEIVEQVRQFRQALIELESKMAPPPPALAAPVDPAMAPPVDPGMALPPAAPPPGAPIQ